MSIVAHCLTKIQALATLAQLQQQEDHNINRYQVALNTLLFAEQEMDKVIKEIRLSLDRHDEAGKSLMAEEADSDDVTPETSKDKGKQPMRHASSRASEDGEEDDEAAETVPVQLRELLEVAEHDLARELRLALRADAERERHLRDGVAGDVALYEQV